MKNLKAGTYTALVTPFHKDTPHINEELLKKLILRQIENGIDGIVVLGTTGEAPTLSRSEQDTLIQLSVHEAQKKIPIIVGTGSNSTEQTIVNTKRAEELGADIALIVTPYYNKPTSEGIYRHFRAIAKHSSLPLIAYNVPGRTSKNIDVDTLKRLASIENVIAIKECAGDVDQMMDMVHILKSERPSFKIFSGDDSLTLPLIALGGHGVISVASNVVIQPLVAMVKAALSGNFNDARELHYKLLPLFRALFIETNPIPVKTAMNFSGIDVGGFRLPLCEMSASNSAILKNVLSQLENSSSTSTL